MHSALGLHAGELDIVGEVSMNVAAGVEDEPDAEVMPTRRKRGYVTLSDRPSRPSTPPDASSSDDEVMPTKRPRGPPKRRGN